MENKEEKLKADLENNYGVYKYLKDKSKLELIDLLRGRDERLDRLHREDLVLTRQLQLYREITNDKNS